MKAQQSFFLDYIHEITSSLSNSYHDNFDHVRFTDSPSVDSVKAAKRFANSLIQQMGFDRIRNVEKQLSKSFQLIEPNADRFQRLFDMLADKESKSLLIKLLTYRSLGHKKVRLPLSTPTYWEGINRVEQLVDRSDFHDIDFLKWRLYRINLNSLGFPIELYDTAKAVYTQFVLQQYRCKHDTGVIQAERGDYIIDAGGCWGDTALYFSNAIGDNGKVFSYEFIPSNLELFSRNLQLNPALRDRVELIEKAVWDKSDLPLYYVDNGPGSRVSFDPIEKSTGKTETLAIDDLVEQQQLPRVDLIKMDIEGAELNALKGAVNTLKQHRPKLAIAIYHSLNDFLDIPEFISGLDVGYSFYIRHFTIHREETILFAKASDQ